jgi:hypothetical protein
VKQQRKGGGRQPLSSVEVLGRQVLYRRFDKLVLLSAVSVLDLAQRQLPILSPVTCQELLAAVDQQKEKNPGNRRLEELLLMKEEEEGQTREGEADRQDLISWGTLRSLLNGFLIELALTDLFSSYRYYRIL